MVRSAIQTDHSQRLALPLYLFNELGRALQLAVEYQDIDAEVELAEQGLPGRYRASGKSLELGNIQGPAQPESMTQVLIDQ